MPVEDRRDEGHHYRRSPTGPSVTPPRGPTSQPAPPPAPRAGNKRRFWSVAIFLLAISGVGVRAYKDLSQPAAWAYWKDQYSSPNLTSSPIAKVDLDGSGQGRPALAISGTIGPAAANWFRDKLDQAHLVAGDVILLSSPGGDLYQAIIMGEIIRSRGLVTAVGAADAAGQIRRSYCASACVMAYAGGKVRFGVEGSMLGVHRFTSSTPGRDPVAESQRVTGAILSYMTQMGVSSSVVEAMTATSDIRWLGTKEAAAMNLVTSAVARR